MPGMTEELEYRVYRQPGEMLASCLVPMREAFGDHGWEWRSTEAGSLVLMAPVEVGLVTITAPWRAQSLCHEIVLSRVRSVVLVTGDTLTYSWPVDHLFLRFTPNCGLLIPPVSSPMPPPTKRVIITGRVR